MTAKFDLYQTIRDPDGEEVESHNWDCANLHDAVADLRATRTAHCDGVRYNYARYLPLSDMLLITVQNGIEFRTGCTEERELAIVGINRGSARRLSRLLGCEWCA